MSLRPLVELLNTDEPAWPLVEEWAGEATNAFEILAAGPEAAEALWQTQVTVRSPMGAVVYHSGGLIFDHGWLRVLGSGHVRLRRTLPGWNRTCAPAGATSPEGCYLVADDVLGGFFAMNGGRWEGEMGMVHYFAPDSLEWESLDVKYTEFLQWCFSGDLKTFYKTHRWRGWKKEIAKLGGDEGIAIFPFLSCEGPKISERNRGVVPVEEQYRLFVE
jgi:hypothetical protein